MYGYRLPGACGAFVLQTAFVLWAGRPLFFLASKLALWQQAAN